VGIDVDSKHHCKRPDIEIANLAPTTQTVQPSVVAGIKHPQYRSEADSLFIIFLPENRTENDFFDLKVPLTLVEGSGDA
jgi:hypothetical protein